MIIPPPIITPKIITYTIPTVPFYSQFNDIHAMSWKKVGCGITSLAMIIEYYKPGEVSVDNLLKEGILISAYDNHFGWIHKGLIALSKDYGLEGKSYDMNSLSKELAFSEFKNHVATGPVMASVHYKFDPRSSIPHLVVIDGIKDNVVYYNDPAAKTGQKQISITDFQKAWKKKFIVIRPVVKAKDVV
jgi:ABC-type bacteriocin/lantibiotic exporter with double-glycine peptidase domain